MTIYLLLGLSFGIPYVRHDRYDITSRAPWIHTSTDHRYGSVALRYGDIRG
jgi:hypothetical protein